MSYAPIYNKLRELDERVALMESTPKTTDEGITIVPIASNGLTTDELNKVKTDFENLLKESSALSTRIGKLTSLDLATLATKDELATLATKDEVANLLVKFDNVINVISQLNAKINDAQEKLADL